MPYEIHVVEATPTVLAVRRRTTFESLGKAILESLDAVYALLKTAPVQQRGHNVVVYLDAVATVEVEVQVTSEAMTHA